MTVVVPEQAAPLNVGHWTEVMGLAVRMAEYVNGTEFVPTSLRGRPEAVAATIIYGAEIGVTPMQALSGIHIVEGRPAPSAELMRALILRAGHTFAVHEFSGTRVRVSGLRRGRPESERVPVEWTIDMARAAGLLGRSNWRNYPRAMLMARATGDMARILFPDVVKGLGYVAEESLTDAEVGTWGPPEVAPNTRTPRTVQRKGRGVTPEVGAAEGTAPTPGPTTGETIAPAPPTKGVEDVDLPEPVCTNCGNDLAAEGQVWCTDCLARDAATAAEADTWLTDEEAAAKERSELDAALAEKPSTGEPPGGRSLKDPYHPEDQPLPPEMQPRGGTYPVPVPELHPEVAGPEAPPPGSGPALIGERALKALNTLLSRELGSAGTDEERHQLVEAILGREVPSLRKLTRAQGITALAEFDRFATGEAGWEFTGNADAPIRLWDNRVPPPEDE